MRYRKYFTVKEWNKFDVTNEKHIGDKTYYLNTQEVLCKKYDIILTDYKTKREKITGILKSINMKNFDRGMKVFDGAMKEFDKSMKDFGKELGHSDNVNGWGPVSSNKVPLWMEEPSKKSKRTSKKKKKKKALSKDQENVKRLMG